MRPAAARRSGSRTPRLAGGCGPSGSRPTSPTLSGTGRLLGQVAGRTGKAVTGWLDDRGQDWKDQVKFVAIDPCAVYRSAVERALPHAVIVVDHFHLVRLANQAVTRVRQRVTRQVLGRRGTTRDPAWANRRTAAARPRAAHQRAVHPDVGGDPRPGGHRRAARRLDRQGGAPLPARPWPAPARPGRRSATGCSRSTTGAPAPTCPRSPPWPARSRPGGRRSWPSSTPASPTPAPKPTTGWSKTPPGSPSGSATSTTSAAEYGCTANGRSSVSRCEGDQPPQPRRADNRRLCRPSTCGNCPHLHKLHHFRGHVGDSAHDQQLAGDSLVAAATRSDDIGRSRKQLVGAFSDRRLPNHHKSGIAGSQFPACLALIGPVIRPDSRRHSAQRFPPSALCSSSRGGDSRLPLRRSHGGRRGIASRHHREYTRIGFPQSSWEPSIRAGRAVPSGRRTGPSHSGQSRG